MFKNTVCSMVELRPIMNLLRVVNHMLRGCFVFILSLQMVACTGGQTTGEVPNAPIQNYGNRSFASQESSNGERVFLKNVCELTPIYNKRVAVKMPLDEFLRGIACDTQEYDFMWKDGVLDYGDYIEIQPYYTTDELDAFAEKHDTIEKLKEYIEGFVYENTTDTEQFGMERVMSGHGNCVTASMMLGYWVNKYSHDNGYCHGSVFADVTDENTVGARFIKANAHVYLQVIIGPLDNLRTYNLDPAVGKGEFYDLLFKLKVMEAGR